MKVSLLVGRYSRRPVGAVAASLQQVPPEAPGMQSILEAEMSRQAFLCWFGVRNIKAPHRRPE